MRFWTEEEIDILRERYPNTVNAELAEILGRTRVSITLKASKLRLKKNPNFLTKFRQKAVLKATNTHLERGDYRLWTEKEKQKLVKLYYDGVPTIKIVKTLRRTDCAVRGMMATLGLHGRDKRRIRSLEAERLAKNIMRKQGYKIIERGGNNKPFDYLVSINGELFAIDVKSGTFCESPSTFMNFLKLPYKRAFLYVVSDRFFFMPVHEIKLG